MLGANVQRAALVGDGISQSLTPALHRAEGRALRLKYSYGLIDTGTDKYRDARLCDILMDAQAAGYCGLNITHPHKVAVVRCLDDLSDTARRLGAVNAVVFRAGRAVGHNTDFSGFIAAFRQTLADACKDQVLLLGAGGAGAAVGFALIECGVAKLRIYDAGAGLAAALTQKINAHHPLADINPLSSLGQDDLRACCGVVNATPMGMATYPGSAVPLHFLRPEMWVADIVYMPHRTALLDHARGLGCQVMSGAGMAVFQAARAFELFTRRAADARRMERTFRHASGC